MAQLDVTRAYEEGEILLESDLDTFLDDIETFINVTLLDDDNFQTGGIDAETKVIDSTVTTAVIGTGAIMSSKIADSAVTTAKILDSNVTTIKIADLAVTTAKIADTNITTAKIADSAITTAKIAANAVTVAKKADVNYAVYENDSFSVTIPYNTSAAIGGSATITSVGRPVLVSLSSPNGVDLTNTVGVFGVAIVFLFKRNGTLLGRYYMNHNAVLPDLPAKFPINYLQMIDVTPTVGSCVYTVDAFVSGSTNGSATVTGINIKAVEL